MEQKFVILTSAQVVPAFPFHFIPQNETAGYVVVQVSATDADVGANGMVQYNFSENQQVRGVCACDEYLWRRVCLSVCLSFCLSVCLCLCLWLCLCVYFSGYIRTSVLMFGLCICVRKLITSGQELALSRMVSKSNYSFTC